MPVSARLHHVGGRADGGGGVGHDQERDVVSFRTLRPMAVTVVFRQANVARSEAE